MDEIFAGRAEHIREESMRTAQERPQSSRSMEKQSRRDSLKLSTTTNTSMNYIPSASCLSTARLDDDVTLRHQHRLDHDVTLRHHQDSIDDSMLPNLHLTSITTLNPISNSTRIESIASISNLDNNEGEDHDESGRTLVV